MKDEILIFDFTTELAELLNAQVSLKDALLQISEIPGQKKRIALFALEIEGFIDGGMDFYAALDNASELNVPEWYKKFVLASMNGGNLSETMNYLSKKMSEKMNEKNDVMDSMLYPLVVILMTFILGCGFAFFSPISFYLQDKLLDCLVKNSLLMLVLIIFTIWGFLRWGRQDPCESFFSAMQFLTKNGTDLISALEDCVCLVDENMVLAASVMEIRQRLLSGEECSSAFGMSLAQGGFSGAGKLISRNLALVKNGKVELAFEKSLKIMSDQIKKKRKKIAVLRQPVLLGLAAVYMALILKDAVLPLIIGENILF